MRKLLLSITLSLAGWAFAGTQQCDDAFAKPDYVTAYKECLPLARQGDGIAQAIIGYLYDFGQGGVPQDYTQAATWYQLAVQQNVPLALNNMGELYQYGLGVAQSDQKAFELYLKSSAQGNRKGQYLAGYFYEQGRATPQNYTRALELYRKSADQGYAQAQNAMGYMYEFGYGVKSDYTQALSWYRKAADQEYEVGQYNVGYVYRYLMDPPNDQEAFKWFQKSALLGHADAQNELAYMYQYGYGTRQDFQQAIRWYGLAIEQENSAAYNNLGIMYRDGQGVKQDYQEAMRLFQKSADLNSSYGAYNLAYLYYNGLGVKQDYQKALQFFTQSANRNYADAQNYLGIMYQYGYGVKQDPQQALNWYQKAAEQNNKYALYNLAYMYSAGLGTRQDQSKAAQLYERASAAGYPDADAELGYLYLNGQGVTKDEKKAAQLFQKAADAGVVIGQNNLGYMYELGLGGLPRDYAKAVFWYQKAADQNYTLGLSNLGLMYENGSGVPEDPKKAFELYMKAAQQDDSWAQNRVGIMYYKGKGVAKDAKKAEEWLRKAIAQGNTDAQSTLDLLLGDLNAPTPSNTNTNNTSNSTTTVTTNTPVNTNQIKIDILDPKPGATVSENWIFLKVRTSKPMGNMQFRILVNGKEIGTASRAIGIAASSEYELPIPVDTTSSNLNIEVSAYDGQTLMGQSKLSLTNSKGNKNQFTPQGNLYILAVGIDEYKYVSKDRFLKYSVKDATDIVAEMKKQQGIVYNNVYDFSLHNNQATWENIQAAMIRVQKLAKPEDTVIAFFSGHGEQMDGRYYVITYDTDPQYLRRTGLMQDELTEFYAGLQSNTIVILDTCRAGGINGVRAISNPKVDGLVRALETTSNAVPTPPNVKKVIFAATGGESYAYEDPAWGNGAFTKAFLEALRGEKSVQNNAGLISILRLGAYLGDRVQELTGGKQVPNIQLSSSDWVIANPQ
ncbi:caspase family protein [Deinococcus cellulosilyticus]|uniref:Peptidase C14 caspase domain-containing protein n=1 Tax=Deinococcus cellulosilyticus (strain DSM 18568 / NBRC 106333 / KACC 11606 / 5516J-15) TaxID=1223518 RepID=A0A511MXX5_DEIC1|nr:caspase family protein [Deinococcus cellulosilyticus]GEM45434.1 hypothetical protein DC3_10690 [Deinococcus cellulosilyticus NBRC 106333 = KACC 11606]